MPSVPFSVVTLSILVLLLLALCCSDRQIYRGAITFLIPCILLTAVGTLSWSYPSSMLTHGRILLATLLPAIAWQCFTGLAGQDNSLNRCWHGLPVALTVLISIVLPAMVDVMLFLLYAGYGSGLILFASRGGDRFVFIRLSKSSLAAMLAVFAGGFLCFSAMTDLLVALVFVAHKGSSAPQLIAILQGLMLPFIALAIVLVGRTRPTEIRPVEVDAITVAMPEIAAEVAQEQTELSRTLEKLVREKQLFLDVNLTLTMLARKSGIPARQISRAINASHGCNVSQWINGFRIERAQQLLLTSTLPVTEVMQEIGFMTKSNFNREFLRITGMTPTVFRQGDNSATHSENH